MSPGDFIGNVVLIGSVLFVIVGVILLPILRRKELAQVAEERSKPMFVELRGSTLLTEDGQERSETIGDLSTDTELVLKRKSIEGGDQVEVMAPQGQPLGALPATLGSELAKELAAGQKIDAKIDLLTGGTESNPDYYIKLVLKRLPSEKSSGK